MRFVGEGTTPLIKGRWPEGPEGIGNCPSRRISEISPCLAGRSGPGPYDKERMASGYTVGTAISRPKAFPLSGGRCRAHARRMRVGSGMTGTPQRAGQCPAPTKERNGFRARRRGGPMWPPAGEGFSQCRAGACPRRLRRILLPDAPSAFSLSDKKKQAALGRPAEKDQTVVKIRLSPSEETLIWLTGCCQLLMIRSAMASSSSFWMRRRRFRAP